MADTTTEENEDMFDDVGLSSPLPANAAAAAETKSSALQDVDDLLTELDAEFAIGDDESDEDVDAGIEEDIGKYAVPAPQQRAAPQSVALSDNKKDDPWLAPHPMEGGSGTHQPSDDAAATEQINPSSSNDEAIQRLKSSTAKLTQAVAARTKATASELDARYHLRESVSQTTAKIDSDYKIKERTSSLWNTLRGSVTQVGGSITASAGAVTSTLGVDSTRVTERASEVTSSVTEKAKGVGSEIGNAVRESTKITQPARESLNDRFGDKLSKVGTVVGNVKGSVKHMDEQYGISTKTVEVLAGGAELLTKSLDGGEDNAVGTGTGTAAEGTTSTTSTEEKVATAPSEGESMGETESIPAGTGVEEAAIPALNDCVKKEEANTHQI